MKRYPCCPCCFHEPGDTAHTVPCLKHQTRPAPVRRVPQPPTSPGNVETR